MEFNPEAMVGNFIEIIPIGQFGVWNCISYSGDWTDENVEIVKKKLTEEYEEFIQDEHILEVEFIIKPPVDDSDPYTNTGSVGWKYTPKHYYKRDPRSR